MKCILILLLAILVIYFIYIYFSNEQAKLKHKLILLTRYNDKLKKELCINKKKSICAKFSIPENNNGILNEEVNIYLAPISNSLIINTTGNTKEQVKLLDECTIEDTTWLYISLSLESDINCHGWVKKSDFSILCSPSTEITPISPEEEQND